MSKLPVGAQLYTVRNFAQTPEGVHDTFRKVKEIGFDVVQVSGLGEIDPQQLKEYQDECGLKICITHSPFERMKNDLDALIAEHKLWGCDSMGIGHMPDEFRGRDGFLRFAEELNAIAAKLAECGMTLGYHNHRFEFQKFDDVVGLELLRDNTDPKNVHFILDTYWVQAGGANPVEYIEKFAGRIKVLHLKDMKIVDDEQKFAEIGEGNINFVPVFAAAERCGVQYAVIEQDICDGDPFDSLKLSLENIRKFY